MQLKFTRIVKTLPRFLFSLFFLALNTACFAQAKFSTVVNERHPGLSDYIQVEYTIENAKSVEKIEPPSFRNFRIIQGPIQSSGMSIMNGVMSQYKSLTYILQPMITGRLTVPGTSAVIDGKGFQSEAIPIEVSKKSSGNNNSGANSLSPSMPPLFPAEEPEVDEEYILHSNESMSDKIKKNLLVKSDVNKATCYEGEPIVATFRLCSRLRSESKVLKRPSLNGFSVVDMIDPEANKPTVQTINGKAFNVHIIRKTQLFPLQAGSFEIDPVELENTVKFIKNNNIDAGSSKSPMQQFLDDFMSGPKRGELVEQSFTLGSKPITITVKPLPALNKPAGFNGAVGKFTIRVDGKKKKLSVGEQLTLKVEIKGQGNFTMINPLSLLMPEGMEVYDPMVKEEVDKTIYPLSGAKSFTYTIVAKDTGSFLIPAVSFSYFDPSEAKYKTISSDSFKVEVTPSLKKRNLIAKMLTPEAAVPVRGVGDVSVLTLISLAALLLAVLFGIFLWARSRRESRRAAVKAKTTIIPVQKIIPPDEYSLEKARIAMRDGNSQQFYREINHTVWKELQAKLNLASTGLNKVNAVYYLTERGASPLLIAQFQAVLNDCEIALYTPVHAAEDMQQSLLKAEALIEDLRKTFI